MPAAPEQPEPDVPAGSAVATGPTGTPWLEGRRVLVAGAGVTGRSVATALVRHGALVTVTDGNTERLAELSTLREQGVELVAGLTEPPRDTDLVVTSPGWKPSAPLLVAAADAGIEVIGEVELAWRLGQERAEPPHWLVVTGTNGKTTAVGMLESILVAAGLDAVACGNIGLPVVDAVLAGRRVLAVELSSFQLHWQQSLRATASAVLNVAEDHLDWHGSMTDYAAAKGKAYTGAGCRVVNADDEWSVALGEPVSPADSTASGSPAAAGDAMPGSSMGHAVAAGGTGTPEPRVVSFTVGEPTAGQLGVSGRPGGSGQWLLDRAFGAADTALCDTCEVRPPGRHNLANALAAAALARAYGVSADAVHAGLRDYQPQEHRAALVAEVGGVRYIDDSKATNPHAAVGSLRAHDSVVWIAGGQLKGASVDALVAEVASRLRAVVVLGVDQGTIAAAVARHAPEVPVHTVTSGDDEAMMTAVRAAGSQSRPGDAVVLAPAAASLDMFRSYGHRGDVFAAAVRALHGTKRHDSGARP